MAREQLERLDAVFGPQYFESGRLVVTVARDLQGVMKVAHKLQSKVNEGFGGVVEVIMEHVKHEWWLKHHETTSAVGLHKGTEVPDVQVTDIPDGIRVHPYKRERMPTLEVLLLWQDPVRGETRGHTLYSVAHPELPSLEQVDKIFAEVEPYFAKRWAIVDLRLAPPVKGEFEEDASSPSEPAQQAGEGVDVTVLACHPYGFARDASDLRVVAHVTQCQPMIFKGVTDGSNQAKICFLPAEVNKIQVAETERFYGTEVLLPKASMRTLGSGPTVVPVELTPKALAAVTVHVFEMPRKPPAADDTDGVIDWASEERIALPNAIVRVTALKDGATAVCLRRDTDDSFVAEAGGLPEGCISLEVECTGYEAEERALFLLVGTNEFFVPLRRL